MGCPGTPESSIGTLGVGFQNALPMWLDSMQSNESHTYPAEMFVRGARVSRFFSSCQWFRRRIR